MWVKNALGLLPKKIVMVYFWAEFSTIEIFHLRHWQRMWTASSFLDWVCRQFFPKKIGVLELFIFTKPPDYKKQNILKCCMM